MHPLAQQFLSSFAEDADLAGIDIDVAAAHALSLAKAGLFTPGELRRVLRAYAAARVRVRILLARPGRTGEFHDIHPLVESLVARRCGEDIGGRVHLGKSRNDQVATDTAIFARRAALGVVAAVADLKRALLALAQRHPHELVPALTHTRPAQATTVAHWALAHAGALSRDADRMLAARTRLNRSPLGSAAVAGTSVPVHRAFTARLLGFDGVWLNALDATSARDQLLELLAALAILQSDCSRLATDVILWSSEEYGVFDYPDRLADTSSAMPQKKNPDPLELIRGRAAATAGALAGAIGIVHGLPSGYSRDLQEVKPALWLGLRHAGASAAVAALVVEGLAVRPGRAAVILERGYAAALDLAELLSLHHGVPFRKAHFAVGQVIRDLAARGLRFSQLGAREASEAFSRAAGRPVTFGDTAWRDAVNLSAGAARRREAGGPGDGPAVLREAQGRLVRLDRAIRAAADRETRARRELARRLGPGH